MVLGFGVIRVTFYAMENTFSAQEIQEFRRIFTMFDKDGDGTVSHNELCLVMRGLGQNPSPQEIQRMMEDIDSDGSGEIDFPEFLEMMTKLLMEDVLEKGLLEAFQEFDKAGVGYLTTDNLRHILSTFGDPLSEGEIDELIKLGDNQGNGLINYHALVKHLLSVHYKKLR